MYIISLSCIIYTYCKLILKSPSGRINKKVLYCIVLYCIVLHPSVTLTKKLMMQGKTKNNWELKLQNSGGNTWDTSLYGL